MRISTKLVTHTVALSVFSVFFSTLLIAGLTHQASTTALKKESKDQLISICDIEKDEIEDYFDSIRKQIVGYATDYTVQDAMENFENAFNSYGSQIKKSDQDQFQKPVVQQYLSVFSNTYENLNGGLSIDVRKMLNFLDERSFTLQYQYILNNPHPLGEKDKLIAANDGTDYSAVHRLYHPALAEFRRNFGFYDLFLVDVQGNVVYTVFKELDFTTSLTKGPYKETNIGKIFRMANEATDTGFTVLSDFEPYPPSYDSQAAFIATPIFNRNNQKIGVLIFQIPIHVIEGIMTQDHHWNQIGLGETGESILVGSDYKLRTKSRFLIENPEGYLSLMESIGYDSTTIAKMRAKRTSIGLQEVKTPVMEAALRGESGFGMFKDYRGEEVLAAYRPVDIQGLHWAILTKIDKEEAFRPAVELTGKILHFSVWVALGMATVAIVMGVLLSRRISQPLKMLSGWVSEVTETQDLTRRIQISSKDELGEMAKSLNSLVESFQRTCQETMDSSKKMHRTAKKIIEMAHASEGREELRAEELQKTGDHLQAMSHRLEDLSKQFKIFEEDAERTNEW